MNGNNKISESNKISDIIKTSLENIRTVVDANTIIGEPINTPQGITILPVSKVAVGFASGGFDYLGKNATKSDKEHGNNFGGGGGSGLSVDPVAFLIISPDGGVQLLPVTVQTQKSDVAAIMDKAPALIDKIKSLLPKKKKKDAEAESDADAEADEDSSDEDDISDEIVDEMINEAADTAE